MAGLGAFKWVTPAVAADGYFGVFVAPINRPAIVPLIIVGNPTGTDAKVSMGVVSDGSEDIANGTKWFENLDLPANDTLPWRGPFTFSPGEELRVKSDTDDITFYVVGNLRA